MEFNRLFLQRGDNLTLYKNFYIKHPKLNDIVELQGKDEDLYSVYLSLLTSSILDIADILWVEQKIWYEDIKSEWHFFIEKSSLDSKEVYLYKNENGTKTIPNKTFLINSKIRDAIKFFTDVKTEYALDMIDKNMVLVSVIQDSDGLYYYTNDSFVLTEHYYNVCKEFLLRINWLARKDYDVVHGGTRYAKKYILENEYKNRMDDLRRKKQPTVTLDSITSSLIAKGISSKEIWDLPIYLVYNLYHRFMQFESWNSTTMALSNGCIDTKKNPINWEKINWSKVID